MKTCIKCNKIKVLDEFAYRTDTQKHRNTCIECVSERNKLKYKGSREAILLDRKQYRLDNIDRFKEKDKRYSVNNREKIKTSRKRYLSENSELIHNRDRRRYAKNRDRVLKQRKEYQLREKDRIREYRKRYNRNNRGAHNAAQTLRRLRKIKASPPWLTREHLADIKKIYTECQNLTKTTGIEYNVDHIIPLRNKLVCGLHVPWNLQILTKTENSEKSNKLLDIYVCVKNDTI